MDGFIAAAHAQTGAPADGGLLSLLFPILLLVVFYFLLIRPQATRAKEHKKMLDALKKGDEIVTSGGLLGRIVEIGDNFLLLELADNLKVRVQRHMIASLMPKGTFKGEL